VQSCSNTPSSGISIGGSGNGSASWGRQSQGPATWWAHVLLHGQRARRDAQDVLEARAKQLHPACSATEDAGASCVVPPLLQAAAHAVGSMLEPPASDACCAWVWWWQLRPRRYGEGEVLGGSERGTKTEGYLCSAVSVLGGSVARTLDRADYGCSGSMGLAVESGGPLGRLRYAAAAVGRPAVAASTDISTDISTDMPRGHGRPEQPWGAERHVEPATRGGSSSRLRALLPELLRALAAPPAMPTLRRGVERVAYTALLPHEPPLDDSTGVGAAAELVLVLGYRPTGRGKAGWPPLPLPADTWRALRALEARLTALWRGASPPGSLAHSASGGQNGRPAQLTNTPAPQLTKTPAPSVRVLLCGAGNVLAADEGAVRSLQACGTTASGAPLPVCVKHERDVGMLRVSG
jgi:hypothetical protein